MVWPSNFSVEDPREVRSLSPEARLQRARALSERASLLDESKVAEPPVPTLRRRLAKLLDPETYAFKVIRRTIVGTYNDGFIHAGN
ncbi:MAG: hypothetical protein AAFR44_16690, partial [Pseudomonadota bacterium]